ncbi:MAG: MFS transporter, partial [Bacilli bacterium]
MKWSSIHRNIKIRLFDSIVTGMLFYMIFPFLAVYFVEMFGAIATGILLAGVQCLTILSKLMAGYYCDLFGHRKFLLGGIFGKIIGYMCMSIGVIFQLPLLILVGYTCNQIAHSVYFVALQAMLLDLCDDSNRKTIFTFFYTLGNIAVSVGPVLGALLFYSHRADLFVASTLIYCASFLMYFKYMDETMISSVEENRTSSMGIMQQLKSYKALCLKMSFFLFVLAGVLSGCTTMQIELLVGLHLQEKIGNLSVVVFGNLLVFDSVKLLALLVTLNGILVVLLAYPALKITQRVEERSVFVLSSVLYALAMFLFAISQSLSSLIIAITIFTLGEVLIVPVYNEYIAKIAPVEKRSQYFAASSVS